jgi:hypothetical protein
MPNHVSFGQLAVEARVVIRGTPSDVEPICFGSKEIEDFVTGNEVGENSQRHRLLIHLAMVSACSLRAPGVVK